MINRAGTEYDIDNLVEDTYEDMYKELSQHYEYEKAENEQLRQKNKEMLRDIQSLEFEDIIEEMNDIMNIKLYKIKEILKKYK